MAGKDIGNDTAQFIWFILTGPQWTQILRLPFALRLFSQVKNDRSKQLLFLGYVGA